METRIHASKHKAEETESKFAAPRAYKLKEVYHTHASKKHTSHANWKLL